MFKILRAYLLASLPLCAIACSAAGSPQDGSGPTTNTPSEDAGAPDAPIGSFNGNESYWPKVVLVNAMVNGSSLLGDPAIRVCIPGYNHALPDDAPMPESSYAGVERGRGADLGTITGLHGDTIIDIFSAKDLKTDGAFTTSRLSCDAIACAPSSGGECLKHVELHVDFAGGPNLVVVRDDPNTPGDITASVAPLAAAYEGQENELTVQVADFSGWAASRGAARVRVRMGTSADDGLVTDTLNPDTVTPDTPVKMPLPATADFSTESLVFEAMDANDRVADAFSQPLASVAYLSDPGSAPSVLFGHRSNCALILVGDPTNAGAVTKDPYDPLFDGAPLHAIAVPYSPASPRPASP